MSRPDARTQQGALWGRVGEWHQDVDALTSMREHLTGPLPVCHHPPCRLAAGWPGDDPDGRAER